MEVAVKHNSISIHNVVHGVHGKGNVRPVKSIRTLSQDQPYSMEDSMYSQPTSTQPRSHMPHPNTTHKPMNIMPRTAQPAKASGQMLPTNTGQ